MKYYKSMDIKLYPLIQVVLEKNIGSTLLFFSRRNSFEIDMVNIFRPAKFCPSITKEAIKVGVKTIWMQLGIISEEAIELANKIIKMSFLINVLKWNIQDYQVPLV